MRIFTCVVAAMLVAVTWAEDALAEAEAGQAYFTAMGSYMDDDNDRLVDDGINGGQFGFGYAINNAFNIEILYSQNLADGGNLPDQDLVGIGFDLQRVFWRAGRFSPYLHAGVGYFNVDVSPGDNRDGHSVSTGVGFLMDLFDSDISLRGEWKYRVDDTQSKNLHDNLYSLGFQIPFGAPAPKFVDSDGDGVADGIDRCPNTPMGTRVDAYGCELDSDGDGVKDSKDKCPDTPAGVGVDSDGCPMDSDGDGVSDDKDKCPGTPAGATVDASGCELDGDNDGVVDRLDECPDSAPGAQVDIKGCEIKEEIRLPGVNFESNSDRLLAGASNVLDDAVATLKKNPSISVEVAGHTDSDGSAAYNEGLSARRAATVRDYLAANGISQDRLTARGYGEAQPIADNGTAAGKAQNRRVVLRITAR